VLISIFSVVQCRGRKQRFYMHGVTPLNTAVLLQSVDWCWLRCRHTAWQHIQLWVLLHVQKVMYFVFVFPGKRILHWKKKVMIRQLKEAWDVAVTAMSLIWLRESSWNTRSRENACLLFLNCNIKRGLSPVTASPFLQE